jgi:hypothetical protein
MGGILIFSARLGKVTGGFGWLDTPEAHAAAFVSDTSTGSLLLHSKETGCLAGDESHL